LAVKARDAVLPKRAAARRTGREETAVHSNDVTGMTDALARAVMRPGPAAGVIDRCVLTVGSPGYEEWVEGLFGSILAHARQAPPTLALFALADDAAALEPLAALAARYGALCYPCQPLRRPNPTSKAILYTAARVIPARRFVCLDADMIVFTDLDPLFTVMDACAPGSLLVCREANDHRYTDLSHILRTAYQGGSPPFFDQESALAAYPLVVNDGLFAGDRAALLALDQAVRDLPGAIAWVDEDPAIDWRNQFVFNTAIAGLANVVELDPTWDVQLHAQQVEVAAGEGRPVARWSGQDVRVLHFCAPAKHMHPELRAWARTL
jgi:nucleotide-binding universal stress UspA family protein